MSQPLSVLYIPTSNGGVPYYRLWLWAVAAHRNRAFFANVLWFQYDQTKEGNSWEVDITDPAHSARIMNELWSHFQKADVVVMGMCHTPASLNLFLSMKEASQARGGRVPILAEIDDNMLSLADYNPSAPFYDPGTQLRALAIEQFKAADGLIVSTNYLKEVYSDLNENIYTVHNSLDFKLWDKVKRRHGKGIKIGWMGGASHNEDLRIVEPVVRNILAKYPNVSFEFVHGIPDFFKGVKGINCVQKWTRIDKYPGFLAGRGFDIGIAPLVDNAFNRGKSNLRWLEYAGLGVPCVASNVGHFKETLTSGKDALLADNPEQFQTMLEVLINDRTRRRAMGLAANARARRDFNIDRNVFAYEEILREACALGQVKPVPQAEYDAQVEADERLGAEGVYS